MKISNNTILINGGSAGIGLAMARLFSVENKVIITGRDQVRLDKAVSEMNNVTGIICDVTKEDDVTRLIEQVKADLPDLNVIINNAGKGNAYDITEENIGSFEKASEEMLTNYLSVIRLCEKFLPILKERTAAAIVNVTSIAVFGPRVPLATYGASKAALHAYTLALRFLLERSEVRVFELMPPLTDTDFTKEFNGPGKVSPELVAKYLFHGFEKDEFEIHVGQTAEIHDKYFADAYHGFLALNNAEGHLQRFSRQ